MAAKKKKTKASKKAVKRTKTRKAPAKKAKKTKSKAAKSKATRGAKPARKVKAAKKASKKTAARKPAKKAPVRKKKQIVGEGDYEASRAFLKDQSDFVQENKARIPEMGRDAREALEGSEGPSLMAAEAEAKSHSRNPE